MQARELKLAEALERRRDSAQALETALLREQQRRLARARRQAGELRESRASSPSCASAWRARCAHGIRTNAGGLAQPPPGAPPAVGLVIAAGNAIAGLPYLYGGGHGGFKATAYDCSGSISYALAAAGLVTSPMASGPFMSWGEAGPGKWITVYANPGHAFMVVAGWRFDTSALRGGGTRWTRADAPHRRLRRAPPAGPVARGATPPARRSAGGRRLERAVLEVRLRPAVVGAQRAGRPRRDPRAAAAGRRGLARARALVPAEAVVVVQAHELDAVAVGDVDVRRG